jgi:hypothetical protein
MCHDRPRHQREGQRKHCGSEPTARPDRHRTLFYIVPAHGCKETTAFGDGRPSDGLDVSDGTARLRAGLAKHSRVGELVSKTAIQHRLTPYWKRIGGRCHLARKMDDLIRTAEFELSTVETGYMTGPKPWTFMYQGSATS